MIDLLGLWSFSLNFCFRNKIQSLIFGQFQKPSLLFASSRLWMILAVQEASFKHKILLSYSIKRSRSPVELRLAISRVRWAQLSIPFSSNSLATSLKNLPMPSRLSVGYTTLSSRRASSLRDRWTHRTRACLYYFCCSSSLAIFCTIATRAPTCAPPYIRSSFSMCATASCAVAGSLLSTTNKLTSSRFACICGTITLPNYSLSPQERDPQASMMLKLSKISPLSWSYWLALTALKSPCRLKLMLCSTRLSKVGTKSAPIKPNCQKLQNSPTSFADSDTCSFSWRMWAMKQHSSILRSRKRQNSITRSYSSPFPSPFPKVISTICNSLLQQWFATNLQYLSPSFRTPLSSPLSIFPMLNTNLSSVITDSSCRIFVPSRMIFWSYAMGVTCLFFSVSMLYFPRKMSKMLTSSPSQARTRPSRSTARTIRPSASLNTFPAASTPSPMRAFIPINLLKNSAFWRLSSRKTLGEQWVQSLSRMNCASLLPISCMRRVMALQGASCCSSPCRPVRQGGRSITWILLLVMLPQKAEISRPACMTVSRKQAQAGAVLTPTFCTRLMTMFTHSPQLGNITRKLFSICSSFSGITNLPLRCCSVTTIRKRTSPRLAAIVRMQWKLMSSRSRELSAWPGMSTMAQRLCPSRRGQKLGCSVTDCCVLRTTSRQSRSLGLRQVSWPQSQTTFMAAPDIASASVDLPARVLPIRMIPRSSHGRPSANWKRYAKSQQLSASRSGILDYDINSTYNAIRNMTNQACYEGGFLVNKGEERKMGK